MHKYIFILTLAIMTVFGIKVTAAENTEAKEKLLGVVIWAISIFLLMALAHGDLEP
jgi:hypothetical protein